MKRLFLVAFAISIMAFSCEKEEGNFEPLSNICSVKNPVEELGWLKEEIQSRERTDSEIYKYFYILQAEYNQQTVFIYDNCCPMCSSVTPVYNCQGKLLFYLSNKPEESKRIKNAKIIWKPNNFACPEK
ncbi:hypothetical protein [Adhaeribacter rhizoryzae]|uniref:Lipoprotein n=1 Tax=Adhaeribacter rhizoryzae TaxID=2607907 RepID=A0A5M6D4F6_9BACT|nr:hypothetical protein [Adhaeribacter rhizoryzae]KAA5542398.1 hypothetical protein F0145_19420 [Adhaeribacter rhizoryzae]